MKKKNRNQNPLPSKTSLLLGGAGVGLLLWGLSKRAGATTETTTDGIDEITGGINIPDLPGFIDTTGSFNAAVVSVSMPSLDVKKKIIKFIGLSESNLNYALIADKGEFSYGIMQANLEAGSLARLLAVYIKKGGMYAKDFLSLANWTERAKMSETASKADTSFNIRMSSSGDFRTLLVKAAKDPIMREAQHQYFSAYYLNPAYDYAQSLGFSFPVSYLVLAQSFITYPRSRVRDFVNKAMSTDEQSTMKRVVLDMRQSSIASLSRRGYPQRIIDHNTRKLDLFLALINTNPSLEKPFSWMGHTI